MLADEKIAAERQAHLAVEHLVPCFVEDGPPGEAVMVILQPDVWVAVPIDPELAITFFRVDHEDVLEEVDVDVVGNTPPRELQPTQWAQAIAWRIPDWRVQLQKS